MSVLYELCDLRLKGCKYVSQNEYIQLFLLHTIATHHENYNEDEADSHDDEEWDQVVLQRQTEVRHENHMTTENTKQDCVCDIAFKQVYKQEADPVDICFYICQPFNFFSREYSLKCDVSKASLEKLFDFV